MRVLTFIQIHFLTVSAIGDCLVQCLVGLCVVDLDLVDFPRNLFRQRGEFDIQF